MELSLNSVATASDTTPAETLSERVGRIVQLRTASRIHDLRVDVQGTDVILTGVAPTYYVKQLATHAALDEIDQRTLTNDIDVQ